MRSGSAKTSPWPKIWYSKLFCVHGGLLRVYKTIRRPKPGYLTSCGERMPDSTNAIDRNWSIIDGQSIAETDDNEPDGKMDRQLLHNAINRLESDYREPLLLQVIGGFSGKEIADILGLNNNAVMTRLFRARGKLKVEFGLDTVEIED